MGKRLKNCSGELNITTEQQARGKSKSDRATELFGFMDYSEKIEFDGGSVIPACDFDNVRKRVVKNMNLDGFVYPPLQRQMEYDPSTVTSWQEKPNTKRPALLHKMPASHILNLSANSQSNNLRESDSGFIMYLLSYIFGTRLQFYDWWLDGRVPVKSTNNIHFLHSVIEKFISQGYKTWKSWNDENRKLFINILYMHSRVPHYEWDWERFLCEYLVFDAAYSLSKKLYGWKKIPHKERFKSICEKFDMQFNDPKIDEIYKLRNSLFHESLWDGGQPCTGKSTAFMQPHNLRRFNNRLFPALLDYKTPFIQTAWWNMGSYSFDEATN